MGTPFRAIGLPSLVPALSSGDRLTFEIWVRKDQEYSISLGDLGLAATHERFWGKLPTDEEVYRESDDDAQADAAATLLWTQVGDLFRFPLAGIPPKDKTAEMYFPLSMTLLPENYLGAIRLNGSALERDGLVEFMKNFSDRDLIDSRTLDLASEAEYLMYLSPAPRHSRECMRPSRWKRRRSSQSLTRFIGDGCARTPNHCRNRNLRCRRYAPSGGTFSIVRPSQNQSPRLRIASRSLRRRHQSNQFMSRNGETFLIARLA